MQEPGLCSLGDGRTPAARPRKRTSGARTAHLFIQLETYAWGAGEAANSIWGTEVEIGRGPSKAMGTTPSGPPVRNSLGIPHSRGGLSPLYQGHLWRLQTGSVWWLGLGVRECSCEGLHQCMCWEKPMGGCEEGGVALAGQDIPSAAGLLG